MEKKLKHSTMVKNKSYSTPFNTVLKVLATSVSYEKEFKEIRYSYLLTR